MNSIYYLLYGAAENVFGTFNASGATTLLPYYRSSLQRQQSKKEDILIRTGKRSSGQKELREVDVSGSIDVPVDTEAFQFWLNLLLGNSVEDQSTESQFKKVYRPEDSFDLGSFCTCQGMKDRTDYYKLGTGLVVNDMNLTLSASEISCSFGILGRDVQYVSATNYPFSVDKTSDEKPDIDCFQTVNASCSIDTFEMLGDFTDLTLTISNNCAPVRNIKSGTLVSGFRPKTLAITGTVKGIVKKTLLDMGINNQIVALEFELKKNDNSLKFALPNTSFSNPKDEVSGDDDVYVEMDFTSEGGASAIFVEYIAPAL